MRPGFTLRFETQIIGLLPDWNPAALASLASRRKPRVPPGTKP